MNVAAHGVCKCSNPIVINRDKPCGKGEDCLVTPCIYIPSEESIYPCNQSLVIDLSNEIKFSKHYPFDNAILKIIESSNNLKDVSFTVSDDKKSIEVSLKSNWDPTMTDKILKHMGTILYEVRQGPFTSRNKIIIAFKSRCANIPLPDGGKCDECTGEITVKPEIKIGGDNSTINLEIKIEKYND